MGIEVAGVEHEEILERIEELRAAIEKMHQVERVSLSSEGILKLSRQLDHLINRCFSTQMGKR